MNVMPTLEGGLRIDVEDDGDWKLLLSITHDAVSCNENLARRLGKLIRDEEIAPDWGEYIIPDLEQGFHEDLTKVATIIAAAHVESAGGPGPLWITRDEGAQWYSALNQARLSLEEIHHFGATDHLRPVDIPPRSRSAFMRSQFYCAIQSLLLGHVMR